MKNNSILGKSLSKNEMKAIKGGFPYCNTNADCANNCAANPNLVKGTYCTNHTCRQIICP